MTEQEKRTVVLVAGGGVVVRADFERHQVLRGKRGVTKNIELLYLGTGKAVLTKLEFKWTNGSAQQAAMLSTHQELLGGEAVTVLSGEKLSALYNDVVEATNTEGFMGGNSQAERTVVFHVVTPSGQQALTLRYWLEANPYTNQARFACDLSPVGLA